MRLSTLLSLVIVGISLSKVSGETITFTSGDESFDIEFVTIHSPGNQPDTPDHRGGEWGSVDYVYQIAKHEFSIGAWAIINDESSSFAGREHLPVSASWTQFPEVVNWLNTSQGFHPAYKLRELGEGHGGALETYRGTSLTKAIIQTIHSATLLPAISSQRQTSGTKPHTTILTPASTSTMPTRATRCRRRRWGQQWSRIK